MGLPKRRNARGVTRCAVIGTGHIGRYHAQKYAGLAEAQLVAVADQNPATAARVAAECGSRAETDYRKLLGRVDAVSIAVPTTLHFEVARTFLEAGVHVLIEKPITSTVDEARILNSIAAEKGVVLQVGHLERFNAALLELSGRELAPLFIEAHRLAPFHPRATDVDVVLDLMIHDIDIVLDLVRVPISSIAASGARVLSGTIDIANARIEFENACVCNLTASRVSAKTERKMRIFADEAYFVIDFHKRGLRVHQLGGLEAFPGIPEIVTDERGFGEHDALREQIAAFVDAVRNGTGVRVCGSQGQQALEAAMHIAGLVRRSALRLGRAMRGSRSIHGGLDRCP